MLPNLLPPACNNYYQPTIYFIQNDFVKQQLSMLSRKTIILLFVCIVGFTALYLMYVNKERQASIVRYAGNPNLGDIYKMQQQTSGEGVTVYYLKIKDIG